MKLADDDFFDAETGNIHQVNSRPEILDGNVFVGGNRRLAVKLFAVDVKNPKGCTLGGMRHPQGLAVYDDRERRALRNRF